MAWLSLAVSSLVVVAFLIPLGILVRNQAQDRALSRAERDAQSIAAALAVAGSTEPGSTVDPALARAVLAAFGEPEGESIVFPDGTTVGRPVPDTANVEAARRGAAFTALVPGGAEVLVPVLLADAPPEGDAVVVRSFVPDHELQRGVAVAWAMLAGLGVFLVLVAIVAADRLGRSIVSPVTALSEAARKLGDGDLGTRVDPEGPTEIAEVGEAFNLLAKRLRSLLEAERESVADLSHRLRTPLTTLRLQAETLGDPAEADALLADIDRLEQAVDAMIAEARRPSTDREETGADLGTVVRHRAAFWQVLADEQGRPTTVDVHGGSHVVDLTAAELGALVDTLLENVYTHTPPGAGYSVTVRTRAKGFHELIIEDDGPGFGDLKVLRRGVSSRGGTGLGLDIVAKAARSTGGDLIVGASPTGGARVVVVLGPGDA